LGGQEIKSSKESWLTLIITSLAVFIFSFSSTFLNVAITNLIIDLNTSVDVVQAIITIYALTIACLMLFGAKLQDIVGRRKAFFTGLTLFGIGALLAALSLNTFMLFLGWSILEGIGAALMIPASVSLITGTYSGKKETFALSVWTGAIAVAASIAPILGGFLTTFLSWRYGFVIELILVIFMLIFTPKLLETPSFIKWKDLDILGVILSVAGIFLTVLAVLQLNNPKSWYLFPYLITAGIILLVAFYFWQKKRIKSDKIPLLDINLFKIRIFTLGSYLRMMGNIGLAGTIFIIPYFLQSVLGFNAFNTSLVLLPLTISLLIFSISVNRISNYIKPIYLLILGYVTTVIGCLLLRNIFSLEVNYIDILPGTVLIGVGCGISFPVNVDIMIKSASEKYSDASGVLNTMSNLGWAMGTALVGVMVLVGIFIGISGAVENELPGKYTKEQINNNIPDWILKFRTVDLHSFEGDTDTLTVIANETISKAMNTAIDGLCILFMSGLLGSMLLLREKRIQ
jgi:EmrB/QacA subfamily drug resistance transporter